METKICSKCKIEKPINEFNKNKKNKANNGLQYSCRVCDNIYLKKWNLDNKQYQSEFMKNWRQINKEYLKDYEKNKRPNKIQRSMNSKYRQRNWRKTEKGKAHNKRHNHKRRKLGRNILFENIIDKSEKPVEHHINSKDILYLPDDLHRLFNYSPNVEIHRENLKSIIEQLYPEINTKIKRDG